MNVGTLYAQLILTTSAFDQALTGAGAKLRLFGTQITQIGRDMMVLTAPILAVGGAAVKIGMSFETAFAKIEGLVGIVGEDLEMLKRRVLELSGTTAKSPVELANALYYLTSSGMSAAEASEVLEVAAKGSTIGLGTTEVIAKATAFAINAYRDSGLTAAEATDILTAAVKYGTIEADELAPVLGRLLPIASELDISYNQVAGTLAVMSRTGLDAAEAATSMSSVFSNLLKPSVAAREVLAGVGLSMTELRDVASQEPDGLIQVYRILGKTLNEEQFSVVVPNVRALRGVMNFLSQDTERVDEVMRGVANAAGAVDRAFAITSQTGQFQLNQTMADIEVSMLSLWEEIRGPLIAALKDLSKVVKDAAEWFKNLDDGTKQTIIKLGALLVIIGPLLIAFGTLFKVLGSAVTGFSNMLGAARAVINMLPTILSPIGLVTIAVGALVLAIIGLVTAEENGKKMAHELIAAYEAEHGAIQDLTGVNLALEDSYQKLLDKTDPFKQDLIGSVALLIPVISQMKQAELNTMRLAGATELETAALQAMNDELQRQEMAKAEAATLAYIAAQDQLVEIFRQLGPSYVLTAADLATMVERYKDAGVGVDAVRAAFGIAAGEMTSHAALIVEALATVPAGMVLTEEEAKELALVYGLSMEEVLAASKAAAVGVDVELVDMSAALGTVSEEAERAWTTFSDSARFSMDDVRARVDILSARLTELNEVDLASLGPSALKEWQNARDVTKSELGQLVAYIDSGGTSIIKTMDDVGDSVERSADAIGSAFGSMLKSSDDAWDGFKSGAKKGKDDVVTRLEELHGRMDRLDAEDLQKLGPRSLAGWIAAKNATQGEIDQIDSFVENHAEILETVVPDALEDSRIAQQTAWDDTLGLTEDAVGDVVESVTEGAESAGEALPDAYSDNADDLEDELDDLEDDVSSTYESVAETAADESADAAAELPSAMSDSLRPLNTALTAVERLVSDVFGDIESSAGTWGTKIGAAWINSMEKRIRDGRSEIDSAVDYATASMQGTSPPKVGPLRDIDVMARNVARAWIIPFQDEIRASGLLDMIAPQPMLARLNTRTTPQLAGPALRGYEASKGSTRTMPGITQYIYGLQPGDVERETTTAVRRVAFNWDLEV